MFEGLSSRQFVVLTEALLGHKVALQSRVAKFEGRAKDRLELADMVRQDCADIELIDGLLKELANGA